MSPEQVRGQRTDARSDIFSFGCVLYEMVTGHRAFTGDTSADMMTSILKEEPPSVATSLTGIGPELDRTITRCLEKDAQQRFQSSGDLSFTLRNILSASGHTLPTAGATGPRKIRPSWALAAAAVVIVGGFFAFRSAWTRQDGRVDAIDSLAILPFVNVGGDPDTEYLGDGVAESIINRLHAAVPDLRVVPFPLVSKYRGPDVDLDQVARELDVRSVLSGTVTRQGDQLVVRPKLSDMRDKKHLWGERYNRKQADILAVEEEISEEIAKALRLRLTGEQSKTLASKAPVNSEAHYAYLQGRFWWRKQVEAGHGKAIALFNQAIQADPNYAPAYAGLADAYAIMATWGALAPSEARPKAVAAAQKALELDPVLAEAHVAQGTIHMVLDWEWNAARQEFIRALELDPDSNYALHWHGHLLGLLGHDQQAVAKLESAARSEAPSPHQNMCLGMHYVAMDRLDDAERVLNEAVEWDATFAGSYFYRGLAAERRGQFSQAIRDYDSGYTASSGIATFAGALAYAEAAYGDQERARSLLDELLQKRKSSHVGSMDLARVYLGLGDRAEALRLLEEAYETRDSAWLPFVQFEPGFDALWDEPRFQTLIRRMGVRLRQRPQRSAAPFSESVRLAVLPFEDMSRDPQEWFRDGMTEAVNFDLAQISGLRVTSHTSARRYKDTQESIPSIGKHLDVTHLVLGWVVRDAERIQIRVQVIEANTERQVWAERFQRDPRDALAIQNDVARAIAKGVRV
jgi:serine/threonine-protein kinase